MKTDVDLLRRLLEGMRDTYRNGGNAMEYARRELLRSGGENHNLPLATLVAYDLQSGTYAAHARRQRDAWLRWTDQLSELLLQVLPRGGSVLEVGVGEATTLSGVMQSLGQRIGRALGLDLSWSRLSVARRWSAEQAVTPELFVGDLFNIPLEDQTVDVVYSSHSLEPNGGREREAIAECLRVARTAVVLVEPLYELAGREAQERMRSHGYVMGLRQAAESLDARILDHRLLPFSHNPLNPSGVLILTRNTEPDTKGSGVRPGERELSGAPIGDDSAARAAPFWRCPTTGSRLAPGPQAFFAASVGLAYPVLDGIPLLRPEHAVVASAWQTPSVTGSTG